MGRGQDTVREGIRWEEGMRWEHEEAKIEYE